MELEKLFLIGVVEIRPRNPTPVRILIEQIATCLRIPAFSLSGGDMVDVYHSECLGFRFSVSHDPTDSAPIDSIELVLRNAWFEDATANTVHLHGIMAKVLTYLAAGQFEVIERYPSREGDAAQS